MYGRRSFNDAGDFLETHIGVPSEDKAANMSKLPKPIRIIGYFMIGFMAIWTITFLLILLFQ